MLFWYLIWGGKEYQVRNKYSGKVYVVAESRLSALPSEKPKPNIANGSTDGSKKPNPKTKGSSTGKTGDALDHFEVLEKVSGASLVGLKWALLLLFLLNYYLLSDYF